MGDEMHQSDEIRGLLIEIRDAQRENPTEYRKVTQRSLELQEQAVTRQEQIATLYRRVVVAGGIVVVVIIIVLTFSHISYVEIARRKPAHCIYLGP